MPENKVNCILVIDDDKAHRFLAEKAILAADIARFYKLVKNGQEGIEFITRYREEHGICPSMIFLDSVMPVMDATEFIEEYNRLDIQKRGRDGAIVLMSPNPSTDAILANELGIKSFIEKPIEEGRYSEDIRYLS